MANTGLKKVVVNQDLQSKYKFINSMPGTSSGELVEYAQFITSVGTKQNILTDGNGINITGDVVSVDLATTGSDYDILSVSNATFASLNGDYTKLNYSAYLQEASGNTLDLIVGDDDIDWNGYYKYNGSSTWAVCFKKDTDGSETTTPNADTWLSVLTTTDPTSIMYNGSGSMPISSFIPDYTAVDFFPVSSANESSGDGNFSPSATSPNVSYATGSTPAGLLFDNSKLAIDFAQTISAGSSTKVYPSSIIKTYVDEQIVTAKDLSNQPFNNAIAQITGNPTNAQSALEGLAAEIDTADSAISAANTVNADQTVDIAAHSSVLGVSDGDTNLGDFTDADLTDNADLKTVLNNLAATSRASDESLADAIGITLGDTDLGTMTNSIVPDNSDVKAAVEALGNNIESVQLATRKPLGLVDYYHNADTSAGGVALTAGQIDGSEAFNTAVTGGGSTETFDLTSATEAVTILVSYGKEVGNVAAGVYSRDPSTGILSRYPEFDETGEIPANGYWQVLNEVTGPLAYAFFSVYNTTDPVLGVDPIKIGADSLSGIGNGTVTLAKLGPDVIADIDSKNVKVSAQYTIVANTPLVITHSLGICAVSVIDTLGNDISAQVEIDHDAPSFTTVTIGSGDTYTDAYVTLLG